MAVLGQPSTASTILYVAEVPLLVTTGVHAARSVSDGRLLTLSGKIQVALAPRSGSIRSDHYVTIGKPLPAYQYPLIEYHCSGSMKKTMEWKPLPDVSIRGSSLEELSLGYADSAVISFRYRGSGTLIRSIVFYRQEILPAIERFRIKEMTDPVDTRIRSLSANDPTKDWKGFDSLKNTRLVLPAGKKLDLLIKKDAFNMDSSILYRITPASAWKPTGHLLALDSLSSNSDYSLEIRYRDMKLSNTYSIHTLPYWYQSPVGKYSLVLLTLTFLVAAPYRVYHFRLKKEARKRKQLEEQLTSVHTQLNPHFVFNALSSIEGLVTSKDNDRANEYLSSFSDIMRDTLKNSREVMISLAQEIDTLEKYLRVEQLRFEFKWIMEIQPGLDLDQVEFPPMLLQPVVENAIKHGTSTHGSEGVVLLNFQTNKSDLVITVRDNGGKTPPGKNGGNGYGLKLTNERIARMQELYKGEKISFNLQHHDTGTVATFYFQNWINAYENAHH